MRSGKRRLVGLALLLAAAGAIVGWYASGDYLAPHRAKLRVLGGLFLSRIGLGAEPPRGDEWLAQAVSDEPAPIELATGIKPFRQIGERLGERATDNGYNTIWAKGAAIFDANGDGRLDLFLPNIQETFVRETDADAVLHPDRKMKPKPNVLFLNRGNDEDGLPVFHAVQDLVEKGSGNLVLEELLIEGKYRPRRNVEDDESAPGRVAWGAASADLDGDGRLDLYVLNSHFGAPFQTPELGFDIYPAGENLGRARRSQPLMIRLPSFLRSPLEDGLNTMVDYGTGSEPQGRNTLYLNRGDADNDGIPEWEDVTDATGTGGHWASTSAAIADYDRDGDLDIYVTNFLDPDFYGFGAKRFAGHRNQLYKNLLAETGELRFVDVASELKVAGLHDEEQLASSVYMPGLGEEVEISHHVLDGQQVGEKADHSWAAVFHDWNGDHWLDLVVANDLGNRLRVYENLQGQAFRYLEEFNQQTYEGCWMGMSAGDLDGDGSEEVLVTNCGSQVMSVQNTRLLLQDDTENNLTALAARNYAAGRNTLNHELLAYRDGRLERLADRVHIDFPAYLQPDQAMQENFAPGYERIYAERNFASSLTAVEFAFNAPMFDVDNDGDLDVYLAGALGRGNDGLLGDLSGNPGRLLVNRSTPGEFSFVDRTVEYRLLDIKDMDYDHNPPRRQAPGSGWHKRDYVYLTDTGGYLGMGVRAAASNTHDIYRMHEQAQCVLAADVSGDGFEDLLVTHLGNYFSNSPAARNLKVNFLGRTLAVPAFSKLHKAPTNYEGGETFLYINGGAQDEEAANWVKLRLLDDATPNRYGIGARVTLNERIVRRVMATRGATTCSAHEDLHVGLGSDALRTIEIVWPSGPITGQRLALDQPVRNRTLCIDRQRGVVECDSTTATAYQYQETS